MIKIKKLKDALKASEKLLKKRIFYFGEVILDKYEANIELPLNYSFGMSKEIGEIVKDCERVKYYVREVYKGKEKIGFIVDEVIRSDNPDGSSEIKEYSYILLRKPIELKIVSSLENKITKLPVEPIEEKYIITIEEILEMASTHSKKL